MEIDWKSDLGQLIKTLPKDGLIQHEQGTNFWSVVLNKSWQQEAVKIVKYCKKLYDNQKWAISATQRANEWETLINGKKDQNTDSTKKNQNAKKNQNENAMTVSNINDKNENKNKNHNENDEKKNSNEIFTLDSGNIGNVGWAVPPSMAGLHITLGVYDKNCKDFPSILEHNKKVTFSIESLTSFPSWRELPTHLAGQKIDNNGFCFYPTHFIFLDIKWQNGFEFETKFSPHVSIACIATKLNAQDVIQYNENIKEKEKEKEKQPDTENDKDKDKENEKETENDKNKNSDK